MRNGTPATWYEVRVPPGPLADEALEVVGSGQRLVVQGTLEVGDCQLPRDGGPAKPRLTIRAASLGRVAKPQAPPLAGAPPLAAAAAQEYGQQAPPTYGALPSAAPPPLQQQPAQPPQPPPAAAPAAAAPRYGGPPLAGVPERGSYPEEQSWIELLRSPGNWWDNRANKRNPRAPDFAFKQQGGPALWLTSRALPKWVPEAVERHLPPPPPPR